MYSLISALSARDNTGYLEDTTIEDILKTVETLHHQKDYAGALRALETHQGEVSPGLWHYNMGTIYGKLEKLALARFHILMADKAGYSSKVLFDNKNLIEEKLDIPKLEKPLSIEDYLVKGSLIASQGLFTMMSLLLLIAGIISIKKKANVKIYSGFLFLSVMLIGLNFWVHSWNKMVVIEAQPIHEGPSAIFSAQEELPSGVMLVTIQSGEWLEVIYPTRFSGWIRKTGLKELK
jgi:hypothetical protein